MQCKVRRQVINWLRVSWLLACASIIAWSMTCCGGTAEAPLSGERRLLASVALAALGLPSTIAWWLLLNVASVVFSAWGIELGMYRVFDAVGWLGLVIVGYVQWFVVLPRFWTKHMKQET
jgi:hypothetical protein